MAKQVRKKKEADKKIIFEGSNEGIENLLELYNIEEKIVEENNVVSKMTIFDHINNLTINKKHWNEYSEADKKTFQPYMILLWLSMDADLLVFIDEIQAPAVNQLSAKDLYTVLYEFLPQQKLFLKFIKGNKEGKYNEELVELISNHYNVSKLNAKTYLDIYFGNGKNINKLYELLEQYAYDEKKIKKLMEIK